MMIGLGTDFWGNSLFILPSKQYILESEWLETNIKLIPLFFSFSGAFLAFFQYNYNFESLYLLKTSYIGRTLYTFLNRKWFFDKVYNEYISQPILRISYGQTYQGMDRGLLEFLGPQGIASFLNKWSSIFMGASLGFIFHYTFLTLSFLILFLFIISNWAWILVFLDERLLIILFISIIVLFIIE
jgi:NADH-ubiquinone oxidoreductase chain 5